MKEEIKTAVLSVLLIGALCLLFGETVYVSNLSNTVKNTLNEMKVLQEKTLEEVDRKLKVNEEITKAIVDGINGGW